MARAYRKRPESASHDGADVVDKVDVLARRVSVELPVSLAEVIEGVNKWGTVTYYVGRLAWLE